MQYIVVTKDRKSYYAEEPCWSENVYCVIDTFHDEVVFNDEQFYGDMWDYLGYGEPEN